MRSLPRLVYHAIFWPRFRHNRAMKRFAASVPAGSKVLEFGSGKPVNGNYPFSAARFFAHCEFLQSDVVPEFGHKLVDITNPGFADEFDVVLASSVLEHVYDVDAAVEGIWTVLHTGGCARIRVPFLFPLHDEPEDFWRFTEHALVAMLSAFSSAEVKADGPRRTPLGYVALAIK